MAVRAGDYDIHKETLLTGARLIVSSARTSLWGIPRHPGSAAEIAERVIRQNAGAVLRAGAGHFTYLWTADFGKAILGLMMILPRGYLLDQALRILRESVARGSVPTCVSERSAFDLPYGRADGLPWLVHALDALDPDALADRRPAVAALVTAYLRANLDPGTGLLRPGVRGDWMDTIRRPSSTYNNLLVLHMLQVLEARGLLPPGAPRPAEFEKRLLADRWNAGYLLDHHESDDYLSADANAPALYLGLLPSAHRSKIVQALESSPLLRPVPVRISERVAWEHMPLFTRITPRYHTSAWLHMGLLYVAGLQRERRPEAAGHLARVEHVVEEHGNFVEVIDDDGRPYRTLLHSTEHGLTMAAALYLEAKAAEAAPAA